MLAIVFVFVLGTECLSVDNLKGLHPYVMSHERNLREQQINEQSPWLPDGVMQGMIKGLVFIGFRIVYNRFCLSFVFGKDGFGVDGLKSQHPSIVSP